MADSEIQLLSIADDVGQKLLLNPQRRWVFAESCTAGMVAASLASVPGISAVLCGSWVTYREASKTEWLGIPEHLIARHSAVSREVTEAMAIEALRRTPEAHHSLAITGHLGPGAPHHADGIVHIVIASRTEATPTLVHQTHRLPEIPRVARQRMAATLAITAMQAVRPFCTTTASPPRAESK